MKNSNKLILGEFCIENNITLEDLEDMLPVLKQKQLSKNQVFNKVKNHSTDLIVSEDIIIDSFNNAIYNRKNQILECKNSEVLVCRCLAINYPKIVT